MKASLALLAAVLALAAGCTTNAPNYQPVVANIDAAARLKSGIAVGKFDFKNGEESTLNSVTARADTFRSPVNNSYADYLAEAAKSELMAAGKLDAASRKSLTGTIEKNRLTAGGFYTNEAEVSVRFQLSGTGYDKTITSNHEWESSALGGIAIPRAITNYVITLQRLLNKLYSDPQFVEATSQP